MSKKLKILIFPDPKLRTVAKKVDKFDKSLKNLSEDMLFTMYDANGIGLAATQVDKHIRLVVMDLSEERNEPMVFVNPEYNVSKDHNLIEFEEGCLSIPNQYGEVERPSEVVVRWIDREGNENKRGFDGLWATCIQHEIDHLDGKLFIDYLSPLRRQLITRKMKKFKRENSLI